MADVKWIKITTDMFEHRKIKHLRRLPDGNNIVLIWVMLLTMAGRCNSGGKIFLTESIPYTTKMLADELDFEENTVTLALKAFEQLDMIFFKKGFLTITGWEKYQNIDGLEKIREQTRKRVAKHREKKLLSECNVTSNATLTYGNAIEEEKERDKEKEFSFIHSAPDGENEDSQNDVENSAREYLGGIGKGVVFLNDEQIGDLIDKLGIEEFDYYVGIVADCELKGKSFRKKTHYQAIIDMAMKDRKIKGGVK